MYAKCWVEINFPHLALVSIVVKNFQKKIGDSKPLCGSRVENMIIEKPTKKQLAIAASCVYSIHTVNMDTVQNLNCIDLYEVDWKAVEGKYASNHQEWCSCLPTKNRLGRVDISLCDCYENDAINRAYSDGEWKTDKKGLWFPKKGTMLLIETEGYLTVTRSPLLWERGWCSPCFPNSTDADCVGTVLSFRMPEAYIWEDAVFPMDEEIEEQTKFSFNEEETE